MNLRSTPASSTSGATGRRWKSALPALLTLCVLLSGCITTGLMLNVSAMEATKIQEQIRHKAEAAQGSEPDLIPQSADAIGHGRVKQVEPAYLKIANDIGQPLRVRAQALYQLGLMFMNKENRDQDDALAMQYFQRIDEQFPDAGLHTQVQAHIDELLKRQKNST